MTWFITPQLMQQYLQDCGKSPCSREPEEESSVGVFLAGKQSVPSKSRRTRGKSCSLDKLTEPLTPSLSGTTSVLLTDVLGEAIVTWFREDFLAKTSVPLEKGSVLVAKDQDSGARWQGSLVKCNPDGSGWRIRRCLFPEDLPESSVTLPPWGIVVAGVVYQPGKQVPRIAEIDFGSSEPKSESCGRHNIPTPTAADAKNTRNSTAKRHKLPPTGLHDGDTLVDYVTKQEGSTEVLAWPTPQSRDYKGAPGKGCVQRGGHQSSLPATVARRRTPRSSDADRGGRGDLIQSVRGNENDHFKTYLTPQSYSKGQSKSGPGITPLDISVRPELQRHADRAKERRAGAQSRQYPTPVVYNATPGEPRGMWPTPTGQDAKNNGTDSQQRRKSPSLNADDGVEGSTEESVTATPRSGSDTMCGGSGHQAMLQGTELERGRGALNPQWVEWLMGWPPGWTKLKPLRGFARWRRMTLQRTWWCQNPADSTKHPIPRVTTKKTHRVDRLKAIGNGQVPLCCALAFLTLQRELLLFLKTHPIAR